MPRTLAVSGTFMSSWPGVRVFQRQNGRFVDITNNWSWSDTPHQHYEVQAIDKANGSYWVPVSTNPPNFWRPYRLVEGTRPEGDRPVNPNRTEMRPDGTYFWIPNNSIPNNIVPGETTNRVICTAPLNYPPVQQDHLALLSEIMGDKPADQSAFTDSDGLISFVNLQSTFVQNNPQFTTGRDVCDKVSSFFATIRIKVFAYLQKNPDKVLPGDTPPKTQWDASVTHFMQNMLVDAGGFGAFKITTETYSQTQVVVEFNTDIIKMMFDAITVPENILADVMKFIQGVGQTLRFSWDNRARSYQVCLLGQCHEAVPIDNSGENFVYFPKVKYYYLSVDSTQQEFTSPCTDVKKITFNFKFDCYVTALKASVLDKTSSDYTKFVAFLDKAQGISYKEADNNLDAVLNSTSDAKSENLREANVFGVNMEEYPRVLVPRHQLTQQVLNRKVLV